MKKIITYLFISVISAFMIGCMDGLKNYESEVETKVNLRLNLSLPNSDLHTRAAGGTQPGDGLENKLNDVHIFIFQGGSFKEKLQKVKIFTGSVEAQSDNVYKGEIEVVVLTNLNSRGIYPTITKGQSVQDLYNSLTFNYGTKGWDLSQQDIPMWGKCNLTVKNNPNEGTVLLYRAVSKFDFTVNESKGLDNFKLTDVYVYYASNGGYCAPLTTPASLGDPVTEVSGNFERLAAPLHYEVEMNATNLLSKVYVAETKNINLPKGAKPLCIVIGGIYKGNGLVPNDGASKSYYRMDMKDESKNPYDILRNYLYRCNIRSVSNPGTVTPEDALTSAVVGMEVTIEKWNEIGMNGLSSQYSLATDKSRLTFDKNGGTQQISVSTDYGSWSLNSVPAEDWFSVRAEGDKIVVTVKENYGAGRESAFYVQAGKLKKMLIIEQGQPETANTYLVDGTPGKVYELVTTIKGNGTGGLYSEAKDGSRVKLEESAEIKTGYVDVIWETNEGLIQLKSHTPNSVTGIVGYEIGTIGTIAGVKGGNALIGAFDRQNGTLLWSWHIWVCPGGITEENWTLTGYKVMDRNLGAISNKPGVASLGLLYQWGRKDPFIGADRIHVGAGETGVMKTTNYYPEHIWKVDRAGNTIDFTIKNPTKLTKEGLSVTETTKGGFLWGTNGGLNKEGKKELGIKTIYDPCPAGYRVPPVDAFVFKRPTFESEGRNTEDNLKDNYVSVRPNTENGCSQINLKQDKTLTGFGAFVGSSSSIDEMKYVWEPTFKAGIDYWFYPAIYTLEKTSERHNWAENLTYIPYNRSDWYTFEWGRGGEDYLTSFTLPYPSNGNNYGYFMDYKKIKTPKIDVTKKGSDGYYSELVSDEREISWLPISGAYNPQLNVENPFTFNGVKVEQGSSLTVNSFIWTNSSVVSGDGIVRPAALFLHGAEPGQGNENNGRHIHGMTKDDIKAEPHYAGAVRCVRDEKKDFGESNKVPKEVLLGSNEGEFTKLDKKAFVAVNDSWRVTDPGASWFYMSPDQGLSDKNQGTELTFYVLKSNPTATRREAIVKIKFANEKVEREIKIVQEGKK